MFTQQIVSAAKSGICGLVRSIATEIVNHPPYRYRVLESYNAFHQSRVVPVFELDPKYESLINELLHDYPEALYWTGKDSHGRDISLFELLHITQGFGRGSRTLVAHSLMTFLCNQGAGIGSILPYDIEYKDQWPFPDDQAFIFFGSKWHDPVKEKEFYTSRLPPLLFRSIGQLEAKKNNLTKNNIAPLLIQAEFGKKYAPVAPDVKNELQQAINLLYSSELSTVMLQMVHQVANMAPALPPEIMMMIIGHLLGISEKEANKLYVKKIDDHMQLLESTGCLQALSLFKVKVGMSPVAEVAALEKTALMLKNA